MIYHITTIGDWEKAQKLGEYLTPSLEKEGFIHCSTIDQVMTIANSFYRDYNELIILKINPNQLSSTIQWEAPIHPNTNLAHNIDNNEKFPHVYGTINLDAVVEIITLNKNHKNVFL
ncbi:DUF952 domain-containing protein [Crocosphaera sp. XPORK-15E]|nr:DUF952 domain-containing protein [Crocosphaera sp. XPORK-15E]